MCTVWPASASYQRRRWRQTNSLIETDNPYAHTDPMALRNEWVGIQVVVGALTAGQLALSNQTVA